MMIEIWSCWGSSNSICQSSLHVRLPSCSCLFYPDGCWWNPWFFVCWLPSPLVLSLKSLQELGLKSRCSDNDPKKSSGRSWSFHLEVFLLMSWLSHHLLLMIPGFFFWAPHIFPSFSQTSGFFTGRRPFSSMKRGRKGSQTNLVSWPQARFSQQK